MNFGSTQESDDNLLRRILVAAQVAWLTAQAHVERSLDDRERTRGRVVVRSGGFSAVLLPEVAA